MTTVGRLGYLGLGIETTPGTPVAAAVSIPFNSNSLQGKHEPINDISARASRAMNFTSVQGKKWGEGEVEVNADSITLGWLLKMAAGNENVSTVIAGVTDHLFYPTISGNTPKSATLYNYQGIDVQQFAGCVMDTFDLEVEDALMVAKCGIKGYNPTAGAYTPTTVSGTLYAFNNYQLQLGNTLALAAAAQVTKLSKFMLSIKNNAEVIHESGSATPSRVVFKSLEVTGSFTRFFDTVGDRDNYLNLNKQAMILTASGNALAGSNAELLRIRLSKVVYEDSSLETGIDDLFAIETQFRAEVDIFQGIQVYDILLRNARSASYD
jgi:hypothetical protein